MRCKIIDVKHKLSKHENNLIKNIYFKNLNNQQNLSFVFKICSKLGIKKNIIFKVVNNFKPLSFRQQIIYNSDKLRIINDLNLQAFLRQLIY